MSTIGDWTPWQRFVVFGARQLVRIPTLGRVHVEGLERMAQFEQVTSGALIVVANHASNLDPPLVAGWLGPVLRRRSSVLGKEQLFKGPLKPILRATGVIPVKGGGSDVEAFRATRAVVDRGDVMLVFPEGTRSRDGVIGRAHPGVAMLATRAGAWVLPVGLSNVDRLLGKGRMWPRFGTRVTMRVGEPYQMTLDPSLPRRHALDAASRDLMARIANLVDERQRGRAADAADADGDSASD